VAKFLKDRLMSSQTPAFRSPITPEEIPDPMGLLESLGLVIAFVAVAAVAVNLLLLQVPIV
jgi:hypothetical protein